MKQFDFDAYRRFLLHSNEKKVLVEELSDLFGETDGKTCLDIGGGASVHFSKTLFHHFSDYHVLDNYLVGQELPPGVDVIHAAWETYVPAQRYDVILASHVIYYFGNKKAAIEKMFDALQQDGRIFFVVNGTEADYGPAKRAFTQTLGKIHPFTYHELKAYLAGKSTREYTAPSKVDFDTPEQLYETLRILFNDYPEEYKQQRTAMIAYLRTQIKGTHFRIDQKIIEAEK